MKRRDFIKVIAGSAAAWPVTARAQQPKKIPWLCFLTFEPGTLQSRSPRFDAFFEGLRDLGYEDGQTITIDYLSADGRGERFPALTAECLRLKADIIAVSTTPAAQAAKSVTRTIPIVMIALGDPVGTGLVDDLSHPGGSITGMSMMVPEAAAKRFGLLREGRAGNFAGARAVVPRRPNCAVTGNSIEGSGPFARRDATSPGHPDRR